MIVGDGISRYYKIAGVRGVASLVSHRLFGFPKQISAHPPTVRNPLNVRIRTTDIYAYQEVLIGEEYDFDLSFSPRIIFDVGANIGMASIYFANRYPEARIVAVEAERSNFDLLARNVSPYRSVTPIHAALWNRDGDIFVNETPGGNWAFVTSEAGGGVPIPAITMNTLMRKYDISFIDFLKIDIEGAEKEVFESCNWMDRVGGMAIELHDRFKPGCRAAVEPHVSGFSKSEHGFTTLYRRTI